MFTVETYNLPGKCRKLAIHRYGVGEVALDSVDSSFPGTLQSGLILGPIVDLYLRLVESLLGTTAYLAWSIDLFH